MPDHGRPVRLDRPAARMEALIPAVNLCDTGGDLTVVMVFRIDVGVVAVDGYGDLHSIAWANALQRSRRVGTWRAEVQDNGARGDVAERELSLIVGIRRD